MDNPNNPNSNSASGSSSPFGAPPQPIPDLNSFSPIPPSTSGPVSDTPADSTNVASGQTIANPWPATPQPSYGTTPSEPVQTSTWPSEPPQAPSNSYPNLDSSWSPPVQAIPPQSTTVDTFSSPTSPWATQSAKPDDQTASTNIPTSWPATPQSSLNAAASDLASSSNPINQTPQSTLNSSYSDPAPTFPSTAATTDQSTNSSNPSTLSDQVNTSTELPLSPLDNPWNSPSQPPHIDGSQPAPTQPNWMGTNTTSLNNQTANYTSVPTEAAPTDLSHLITNDSSQSPNQSLPETLVVPPASATPDVPTMPTQNHKGIPKWLIGLGAGLLILVLGASAYFILGIGQSSKETTSLPATTISQNSQLKPPPPLPTAAPVPTPLDTTKKTSVQPVASSSANFGELGGNSNTSPAATSAADLLRQGQTRR